LYVATLDNGLSLRELQGGDLITHQYAQAQLRFSNAPGYPLYAMSGWLWFQASRLLFFLNPIERLSLFSTLWSIAALVVLYRLLLDVTNANWPITALATAFYATTYFFWYYSVATEEYSSAVFHTLILIYFAFRWEETRADKYLLILAFLSGLALAHLVTVLLALPALLAFILIRQPGLWRRFKLIGQAAALVLAPLVSYAYVYIRGDQHPEWRGVGTWATTWDWFWDFLSTHQGRSELTWSFDGIPWEMLRLVVGELTPIVLIAGLVGLVLLPRARAGLLLGIALGYAPFLYVDRYGNWYQVVMPLYPLVVLAAGRLAHAAWQKWTGWLGKSLLVGLLVVLVGNRLMTNYPLTNLRDRPGDDGLRAGWTILADDPPRGATIIGTYAENLALDYITQVWGERSDLTILPPTQARLESQPLYVTRAALPLGMPAWSAGIHLSARGLNLVQVGTQPDLALPPTARALNRDLGDNLRLAGYEIERRANGLRLALYWQATGRIAHDYSISVRPTRGGEFLFDQGQLVQHDSPAPVFGAYPTSRWTPDEVVRDDYDISTELVYNGVAVIAYRKTADRFENLGRIDLILDKRP